MDDRPVLTWRDKPTRAEVRPHALVEVPELSHHAAVPGVRDNLLIHGDNLAALHALRPTLAGQVRCVCVDPPYNTGATLEHYQDGLAHGRWLSNLRDRLEVLRDLLCEDGVLAVQIGFDEMAYLKVLLDEIFGRDQCIGQVAVRMSHSAGMKRQARARRLIKNTEYLLLYHRGVAPELQPLYEPCDDYPVNYYSFIDRPPAAEPGRIVPLLGVVAERFGLDPRGNRQLHDLFARSATFRRFVLDHRDRIARKDANVPTGLIVPPDLPPDAFVAVEGQSRRYFVGRGRSGAPWQLYTLADKVRPVACGPGEPEEAVANLVGDWWDGFWRDMSRVDREGGVRMKASKKPERLIAWVLSLTTRPGDLVLDAWLGSGTTAAVAHKMGRRWVGIERGAHCETVAHPRLQRVVDGADPTGVTRAFGWEGGGGFRFMRLEPA